MNNFPKTLALLAEEQWKAIVNAYRDGITAEVLAQESGTNVATMKQKFRAIEFKHEEGWEFEAIIVAGQGPTLSSYAKAKRNGYNEPDRVLRWRVSRRLADAVMSSEASPDQEEPLVSRLVRVAKLRTSNDFWEFLLSVFSDLTDKDIEHLAGMEPEKKVKRAL